TAVFAASDTMALGVLSELRRLGIDVPGDVSVAGFDDIPGLEFMPPALTTVRVPMAELGAAGVARLLRQLDGDDTATRIQLHPVGLVGTESTGGASRPAGRSSRGLPGATAPRVDRLASLPHRPG